MNYGMIAYVLGWALLMEGAIMTPSLLTALIYREKAGMYILITMVICAVCGAFALFYKPKRKKIYAREGYVIVAMAWFVLSMFGALPFRLS